MEVIKENHQVSKDSECGVEMANSGRNISRGNRPVTFRSVLLLLGVVADFVLADLTVVISEPLSLFLIGVGLIMISQFAKRFVE